MLESFRDLRKLPILKQLGFGYSSRQGAKNAAAWETVGDMYVLAASDSPEAVMRRFQSEYGVFRDPKAKSPRRLGSRKARGSVAPGKKPSSKPAAEVN